MTDSSAGAERSWGRVIQVDSVGSRCPQPVIDLAKAIKAAPVGTVVDVTADDPVAAVDIPAWCWTQGHDYLGERPAGDAVTYRVRRAT